MAGAAGIGIAFLLVYLVVSAGVVVLGFWITYTVIWRAVRRGLREFHHPGVRFAGNAGGAPAGIPSGPRNW